MKSITNILLIIIAVLTISLMVAYSLYETEKKERHRAQNNFAASMTEIGTYRTKNEELVSVVKGYEMKIEEVQKLIPQLHNEISSLKMKIRNAQSITKVVTEYKYINRDSIIYVPISDSVRMFSIDEQWLKAHFSITNCSVIKPGDFIIDSIPNTILAVPEVKYKGWWFWKRPIGVDVHIKQSNPYSSLIDAIYVDLKK